MPVAAPILRAFNAGEFSDLMGGRVDIDRYPMAMRKLHNYVPVPQGPAIGRPGTTFVTPVNDESQSSALMPFVFSETQAFILEFGHLCMRIIYESGPLMDGPNPYKIATPYPQSVTGNIRVNQSGDVVYIQCPGFAPRKLTRYAETDWRLTRIEFVDGPYMPVNTGPTQLIPNESGELGVTGAVIGTPGPQTAVVEYTPTSPAAIKGYYIRATGANDDPDFAVLDSAPTDWILSGFDGSIWRVLDTHYGWELYDSRRTPFFQIKDTTVYQKYKVEVSAVKRNGVITPDFEVHFAELNRVFTLTASSVTGINRDQGFKTTDVGRLIRFKSPMDGTWSSLRITAALSSTAVSVVAVAAPLADARATFEWRLGYWSDTTGWPTVSTFFEDRLWFGGSTDFPDLVSGSKTGAYEDMAGSDEFGTVLDDNAITFQLNSRRISRIAWMQSDERGLLIGTGSGEWVVSASDRDGGITARSIKARNSTARGSSLVEPVKVDRAVVFTQRAQRTVREFTYVFEADGYKSPSLSLFASHMGTPRFVEMDYAAEPHSIIWFRREDGTLAGLTYNRDENVVGWHTHDISGGFVGSIAVIPSASGLHDCLWMVVRRTVNGQVRRYIERLTRFFDFDMSLNDVCLVDSSLRYSGAPTTTVVGLGHLAGETVYGLADGSPVSAEVSNAGAAVLPYAASEIVLGLPYDAIGKTNRIEAGSANGTAQGKEKRIGELTLRVWRSVGGFVGPNEDQLEEMEFRETNDTTAALPLFSGDHPLPEFAGGTETDGCIVFKRPGVKPLPLNIVALLPTVDTRD